MKFVDKLREGDVIYTNCSDYQMCYHLGIVFFDGTKKLIYHNQPDNRNRWGGTVCAESYEDFIKGRVVSKVVRTNAKNQDILRVARKCKSEVWDTMYFNCEDFVLEIVDGKRRSDLRDGYKVAALGLLILLLI